MPSNVPQIVLVFLPYQRYFHVNQNKIMEIKNANIFDIQTKEQVKMLLRGYRAIPALPPFCLNEAFNYY